MKKKPKSKQNRKLKLTPLFTREQEALLRKHGTPAEFAQDTYNCVPSMISMDEAREAVDKYCWEWNQAGKL